MKKVLFFFGALLFGAMMFTSCEKNEPAVPTDAQLKLTVLNSIGNKEVGADVYLYKTLVDYTAEQNVVRTGVTDANGSVSFTGLELIKYYWRVESDCESNTDGAVTTVDNLSAGSQESYVVLAPKPNSIIISSYYDEIYKLYINGVYKEDVPAQGFAYYILPNGTYEVTLKEKSYVFSQNIYSKTIQVECGSYEILNFQ